MKCSETVVFVRVVFHEDIAKRSCELERRMWDVGNMQYRMHKMKWK